MESEGQKKKKKKIGGVGLVSVGERWVLRLDLDLREADLVFVCSFDTNVSIPSLFHSLCIKSHNTNIVKKNPNNNIYL